jgi:hypothetical protein
VTKRNKDKGKQTESFGPLRVDADGVYKPGRPLRAPQPWNFEKRRVAGSTIVGLVPPLSFDTATTVRYEASLFEPELRLALVAVRVKSDISITDLRTAFPQLDKRCSDKHLVQLKNQAGRIRNLRKVEAEILDEDTVYRYLKFKHSRQIKKATKGRPRK